MSMWSVAESLIKLERGAEAERAMAWLKQAVAAVYRNAAMRVR